MVNTIIDIVDMAKTFKDIISCTDVKFKTIELKEKIMSTDDDVFLSVRKCIGSATTILDVDFVDDDFVNKAILGE